MLKTLQKPIGQTQMVGITSSKLGIVGKFKDVM
jgi:hypothetical protein